MDMEASMATFRPKRVLMSCSLMELGACCESRAVSPLIPILLGPWWLSRDELRVNHLTPSTRVSTFNFLLGFWLPSSASNTRYWAAVFWWQLLPLPADVYILRSALAMLGLSATTHIEHIPLGWPSRNSNEWCLWDCATVTLHKDSVLSFYIYCIPQLILDIDDCLTHEWLVKLEWKHLFLLPWNFLDYPITENRKTWGGCPKIPNALFVPPQEF